MTLDDQLRATLRQEAERRDPPLPDVDRIVGGGRTRRRRRRTARMGAGVLAALLVGGTTYAISLVELGDRGAEQRVADRRTEPAESRRTTSALQDPTRRPVQPGTYPLFVSEDRTGDPIVADVTVDGPHWESGDQPVVIQGTHAGGVGVYRPAQVAAASACERSWQGSEAAATPIRLARQLARLPMASMVEAPSPTKAFGRDAVHLRMRIDQACPGIDNYLVLDTPLGHRGITYTYVVKAVLIDFWVLDVQGTTVVVDRWHNLDAPRRLLEQVTRARDSITFVPPD